MSVLIDDAVREIGTCGGLPNEPPAERSGHNWGDRSPVSPVSDRIRCGNPALPLAARLVELACLTQKDLRAEWRTLFKSEPPERIHRDLLLLAIGWKIQERALGGLRAGVKRRLAVAAKCKAGDAMESSIRLKPGTRLVREWQGAAHEVAVLIDGFEWNGEHYRSLSKIAREITGAHWSGPRFFGLKAKARRFGRNRDRNDG